MKIFSISAKKELKQILDFFVLATADQISKNSENRRFELNLAQK